MEIKNLNSINYQNIYFSNRKKSFLSPEIEKKYFIQIEDAKLAKSQMNNCLKSSFTRKQLDDLSKRIENGEHASGEVCLAYIPYAIKIAKEISRLDILNEDMLQEIYLGLNDALENYKYGVTKFATYCRSFIKARIFACMRENKFTIAQKKQDGDAFSSIEKAEDNFIVNNLRKPTSDEREDIIFDCLSGNKQLNRDSFMWAEIAASGKFSLNESIKNGNEMDGMELGESIVNNQASYNPEEYIIHKDMIGRVCKSLNKLPSEEKLVVQMYFGIDYPESYTYADIASAIGKSTQSAKNICDRALMKLKNYMGNEEVVAC